MGRARVQRRGFQGSASSRIAAWTQVSHKSPSSPYYASNPTLKAQADDVTAKGQVMSDAEDKVVTSRADLDQARSDRDERQREFDLAYDAFAGTAEAVVTNEADLVTLGLPVFEARTVALVAPENVTCSSVAGSGIINIRIGGEGRSYVVEVSADPKTDTSFKRVAGTGNTRAVKADAVGLHWVRVAMQKAHEQSAWSAEFPIMVR